jgi:Icc protein
MTRIAHISDTHLSGTVDRRARLIGALSQAKRFGADHLLLTGDLTGHGKLSEFHELRNVLAENWSGTSTIVPGNHDGSGTGFGHVFGSLSPPFVLNGEALIVPLDTRVKRRGLLFRALGKVGKLQLQMCDWLTRNVELPTLFVMHHGPQNHAIQFLEGLIDRAAIHRLLARSSKIHVCCGHDHRVMDIGTQIHTAASCALHPEPLRLYDVGVGSFDLTYRSAITGSVGFAGPPGPPVLTLR